MSAMPALVTLVWLALLPETPKFLAETGQREMLLKVLTRMYVENTGQSADKFKVSICKVECHTMIIVKKKKLTVDNFIYFFSFQSGSSRSK